MVATTTPKGETLELRRTFNAPRQRVYDAWTKPEEMSKWVGPGPMQGHAEADVRVGGAYRIELRHPNGAKHIAHGVYRVVDPPKKVVYTWSWETMPDVIDTLVTVEFHDRGNATEIVLRHEGLATPALVKSHEDGWIGCFDKFRTVVAAN